MQIFLVLSLFIAHVAYTDVILPDQSACRDKRENDACKINNKIGYCKKETCHKLDYSHGSPPRGTISYRCLKCDTKLPADGLVVEASEHDYKSDTTSSCNSVGEPSILMLASLSLGLWLLLKLRRS